MEHARAHEGHPRPERPSVTFRRLLSCAGFSMADRSLFYLGRPIIQSSMARQTIQDAFRRPSGVPWGQTPPATGRSGVLGGALNLCQRMAA